MLRPAEMVAALWPGLGLLALELEAMRDRRAWREAVIRVIWAQQALREELRQAAELVAGATSTAV